MGDLIGSQIISTAVSSLVAAVILRAAAKWVIKEDIEFGKAYLTVFLSSIICAVIGFFIGMAAGTFGLPEDNSTILLLILVPIAFVVQSIMIASRLSTSFGTACRITLVMLAVSLGIALIVGGVVFVVMQFTS